MDKSKKDKIRFQKVSGNERNSLNYIESKYKILNYYVIVIQMKHDDINVGMEGRKDWRLWTSKSNNGEYCCGKLLESNGYPSQFSINNIKYEKCIF